VPSPAVFGVLDRVVLALAALTLLCWILIPDFFITPWIEVAGGLAVLVRLVRWRGGATWRDPLVWVLHLGYGWVAIGFLLLGLSGWLAVLPETTVLHALTVGAIGTMTLAVMTRASLGHTGRPLTAGTGTTAIYVLITIAAALRLVAPLGAQYVPILWLSAAAWCGAFGLFVVLFAGPLTQPRPTGDGGRPI
jgi:uncharacterized protein involved in response to NO